MTGGRDTRKNRNQSKPPTTPDMDASEEGMNQNDDLQAILAAVKTLTTEVGTLTSKIDEFESNFESKLKVLQDDVTSIRTSVDDAVKQSSDALAKTSELEKIIREQSNTIDLCKRQIALIDARNHSLSEKILEMETYSRRENLLFHGVPYQEKENCTLKLKQLWKNHLGMDPELVDNIIIQRCHRLPGKNKPTPMICRFANFADRESVWAKRKMLKDTGIRMAENFPEEISRRRGTLGPIMMEAIKSGKKAMLKYDKLIIDGESYTVNSLDSLPPELDPAQIYTKTKDGVTCFFGANSPLSNFYRAKFTLNGQTYSCVEEFIQSEKALFAERPDTAQAIRNATHPRDMKRLGDGLKVPSQDWLAKAKQVVQKACLAKFQQNDHCCNFLLQTRDNILAEASPDTTWGTGLFMSNERAFDKHWPGQNLLGQTLMQIRNELIK